MAQSYRLYYYPHLEIIIMFGNNHYVMNYPVLVVKKYFDLFFKFISRGL